MRRLILATTLALALTPAAAGAITFGADLTQAPQAPGITCGEGVLNQFLGMFFPGTQANSCLWSSVRLNTSQALVPSVGGTVTTVRVRALAAGPMQIVVVRFLTQNTVTPGKPNLACCFVQAYGPTFTAQAGAITTVPVNLPMQEDPAPVPEDLTTIAANDMLALSVLAPNVPIPLFATNGGAADLSVLSYAWYPAPTAQTVPSPSPNPIAGFADLSGLQVLMNADLTPGAGAGGGGGGGPVATPGAGGGGPAPVITLPKATAPVRNNIAAVPLACRVADCAGLLALQNARLAGAARAAAKSVTYGYASFSLSAAKTGTVKVKLNATGKKLLRTRRSAPVWANVTFKTGSSGKPASFRITLKR